MTAVGHDPSFGDVGSMSALAHFADSSRTSDEVREVPLATLVHCGRPAGGLAVAFPSHVTLVISIINREVPSCELPASCLWSSRCWLSPVLLRSSERLVAKMVTNPQPRVDIEWDTTAIFTIQINTRQDRTNVNKFRVRCFQPSLAPTNASSDAWKVTGRHWPQPSMPRPLPPPYPHVH